MDMQNNGGHNDNIQEIEIDWLLKEKKIDQWWFAVN